MIHPLIVQAERLAEKPAVIDDRPNGLVVTWTYAELNRQANRLAHVFRDLGLRPGERFVWCGPNSLGVVCAGHARAKVGATAVPVNYRLTPEETAYIVEDSDAVLVRVGIVGPVPEPGTEHLHLHRGARPQSPARVCDQGNGSRWGDGRPRRAGRAVRLLPHRRRRTLRL